MRHKLPIFLTIIFLSCILTAPAGAQSCNHDGYKKATGSNARNAYELCGATSALTFSDTLMADVDGFAIKPEGRLIDHQMRVFNECWVVRDRSTNIADKDVFVPARTLAEWRSFVKADIWEKPGETKAGARIKVSINAGAGCIGDVACTGTVPQNAQLCPDDDTGLSAATGITLVSNSSSCAAPKCQYFCPDGFSISNGNCVDSRIHINSCIELQMVGKGTTLTGCGTNCDQTNYPLNGQYVLDGSIDCSATNPVVGGSIWGVEGFQPIGSYAAPFTGKFDGAGNAIQNLYIKRPATEYVGLFAAVVLPLEVGVKNVALDNISVDGGRYTGGLAGFLNSYIQNSSVSGAVMSTSGGANVGGLVGYVGPYVVPGGLIYGFSVTNSWSTATVTSTGAGVGGLIGQALFSGGNMSSNGTIARSFATGAVTGGNYAGGLLGYGDGVLLSQTYATGNATGVNGVGGLAGILTPGSSGTNGGALYCYSTGTVTGAAGGNGVGGLVGNGASIGASYTISPVFGGTSSTLGGVTGSYVGSPWWTKISASFWNSETSAASNGCAQNTCGPGLTNAQMLNGSSNQAVFTGWIFLPTPNAVWKLDTINAPAGTKYPCFTWQTDDTCPNVVDARVSIDSCIELQMVGRGNLSAADIAACGTNCDKTSYPANGQYVLGIDIDCSATANTSSIWKDGKGFDPIGPSSPAEKTSVASFSGTMDGNGKKITGLYINRPAEEYVGLFGRVEQATVENLGLENVNMKGGGSCGGVVGVSRNSTIRDSYVTGVVEGADDNLSNRVGGLVGSQEGGEVINSYASVSTAGSQSTGGLVGFMVWGSLGNAKISRSYATGPVLVRGNAYGNGQFAGGLVGWQMCGAIENVYATGSVSVTGNSGGSGQNAGGLIGFSGTTGGNCSRTIIGAYATGVASVTGVSGGGGQNSGGLIGYLENSGIWDSYWDTQTSGKANACGYGFCAGGSGKTTAEMARQATYAGFDFTNNWAAVQCNYPKLQNVGGTQWATQANCPAGMACAVAGDCGAGDTCSTNHCCPTGQTWNGTACGLPPGECGYCADGTPCHITSGGDGGGPDGPYCYTNCFCGPTGDAEACRFVINLFPGSTDHVPLCQPHDPNGPGYPYNTVDTCAWVW